MLTYKGKPIPMWFVIFALTLQVTLFLILTWID